jgi:hypothetical protein
LLTDLTFLFPILIFVTPEGSAGSATHPLKSFTWLNEKESKYKPIFSESGVEPAWDAHQMPLATIVNKVRFKLICLGQPKCEGISIHHEETTQLDGACAAS